MMLVRYLVSYAMLEMLALNVMMTEGLVPYATMNAHVIVQSPMFLRVMFLRFRVIVGLELVSSFACRQAAPTQRRERLRLFSGWDDRNTTGSFEVKTQSLESFQEVTSLLFLLILS